MCGAHVLSSELRAIPGTEAMQVLRAACPTSQTPAGPTGPTGPTGTTTEPHPPGEHLAVE